MNGTILSRVRKFMSCGRWNTLHDIYYACGGSITGCSARLRDLRKKQFGGHKIQKRYLRMFGTWQYRMVVN